MAPLTLVHSAATGERGNSLPAPVANSREPVVVRGRHKYVSSLDQYRSSSRPERFMSRRLREETVLEHRIGLRTQRALPRGGRRESLIHRFPRKQSEPSESLWLNGGVTCRLTVLHLAEVRRRASTTRREARLRNHRVESALNADALSSSSACAVKATMGTCLSSASPLNVSITSVPVRPGIRIQQNQSRTVSARSCDGVLAVGHALHWILCSRDTSRKYPGVVEVVNQQNERFCEAAFCSQSSGR